MSLSGTKKKYVGLLCSVGIGAGMLLLHIGHALGEDESIQRFLLGIMIPMTFAGGVFIGGLWLWRQGIANKHILRVGTWCTLGAAVLSLGGALIILHQQQYGVVMDEQLSVVIDAASAGALGGFIIGVYDCRQTRARTKANNLTRQLTILNRVLRHDIRNNASVIQTNADLITRETVNTAERADTIKQQATDLVDLGDQARNIEQVLINRKESREEADIRPSLEACCEQIQRKYPSAEVEISLPPTLPVVAHQLIDSALTNVIENAVEHNDKDTPRVTIESEIISQDGTDYVELQIADNGPGIDDNEIDVLERGHETHLEHTSGLGLWLVSWIVTNSGGDLRFEQNEPEGSIVCLRLERVGESIAANSPPNTAEAA